MRYRIIAITLVLFLVLKGGIALISQSVLPPSYGGSFGGAGHLCELQLKNKPGDLIDGVLFPRSSDRLENLEDEAITMRSSDGAETLTLNQAWNVPAGFQFVANFSDILIYADSQEFDQGAINEDTCTIFARVNRTPVFDPTIKMAASSQSTYWGLLAFLGGGVATALRCSVGIPACAALWSLSFTLGGSSGAAGLIARDPADTNYTQIAQPTFGSYTKIKPDSMISSRVASDFNAILATQVQIVGYSKAVYTASNRATGAADANNKTWVDKQTQAARGFLGKLSSLYLQQSDNFKRLKKDWSLNVLLSPGRDYNEEFRGDLVSNPNAPTVVAITNGLKKMGLGSDEIEDVLVIMSGSHTDTRPGLLPSPTSVPPPAM